MKRIGKQVLCNICILAAVSLVTVFLSACKDDDRGMEVPAFNKDKFYLSNDAARDSLFEIRKQPYHILGLSIIDKTSHDVLSVVSLSSQSETTIVDNVGNKYGEIKYGKNDVQEVDIAYFCTIKRKMDPKKGKMYIVTPSADKRDDICVALVIKLDNGIGCNVEIH